MKKLNMRGMAHEMVLVAVVVIFAIAGVGYLVASHADSRCPVSNVTSMPSSSPSSAVACIPVSVPGDPGTPPEAYNPVPSAPDVPVPDVPAPAPSTTSGYTTPAPAQIANAKCVVSGVPSKPKHVQILHPVITITNLGPGPLTTHGVIGMKTFNVRGKTVVNHGGPFTITALPVGHRYRLRFPQYVVSYRTTTKIQGSFSLVSLSKSQFSCNARFLYPAHR